MSSAVVLSQQYNSKGITFMNRKSIGTKLTLIISLVLALMFVGKGVYDGIVDYTLSLNENTQMSEIKMRALSVILKQFLLRSVSLPGIWLR